MSSQLTLKDRLLEIIGEEEPYRWAARNKVSKSTLYNILNKDGNPRGDQLLKISVATGRSIEWLLTGEDTVRQHGGVINGNGNANHVHIEVKHPLRRVSDHIAEQPTAYGDPVSIAFLHDWQSLSDVAKMRVWTMVKEEMERRISLNREEDT